MKKYFQFIILNLLFVVFLIAIYTIHAYYIPVRVVLYSAILDAIIAGGLSLFVAFVAFRNFGSFERFLLFTIWILAGYAFAISGPTVLDRSLSIYILEKIAQRGGGVQMNRIEDIFTKEYLHEHRLMDVRLTEQLESGTIEIRNGCVFLTPRGARIAKVSRFLRVNFLPKKRLLLNKFSDDLTDPFRESAANVEYACEP